MGGALRIVGARLEEVRLAPAVPVATGRGMALEGERRSLLLRLEAADGTVGMGEATPLPRWSPETVDEARSALERIDWAMIGFALDGDVVTSVNSLVASIDAAVPSARFALETALLDVAARLLQVPLHRLLSPTNPSAPLALSVLLDAGPDGGVLDQARAAVARGARTLKWKVGRPGLFDAELATLRALRAELGSAIALRLDANGGLPDDDLEERLCALAGVRPELIEEPSPRWLSASFSPPFPVAADESLLRPGETTLIEAAVRAGRCAAVVLKPMLLGGVLRCRSIADQMGAVGASAIVTHCFDGPIAMTAAAALALALPTRQHAAGLWPHSGLRSFGVDGEPPEAALPFLDGAELVSWEQPGLGRVWP